MEYKISRTILDFEDNEKWPINTWNEVLDRECGMAWAQLEKLLLTKGYRQFELFMNEDVWEGGTDSCRCIGCADWVQGLDYKFTDGNCTIECWSTPEKVMELR